MLRFLPSAIDDALDTLYEPNVVFLKFLGSASFFSVVAFLASSSCPVFLSFLAFLVLAFLSYPFSFFRFLAFSFLSLIFSFFFSFFFYPPADGEK